MADIGPCSRMTRLTMPRAGRPVKTDQASYSCESPEGYRKAITTAAISASNAAAWKR